MEAAVVEHGGTGAELVFRGYRLRPEDRLLLRHGQVIELGGRAFDLLFVLLNSRGNVVSKDDIFEHVWPSTVVDESNLRFQMAGLRRALGDDRDVIKTVKGRGYLLAAEVRQSSPTVDAVTSDRPQIGDAGAYGVAKQVGGEIAEDYIPEVPFVAVIDDDDGTREALEGLFRSTGIRAEVFASVDEFMLSGRQRAAGCLVLDVWMPGHSGLDFQEELRRQAPDLPVIFISGHADVQMSVRAMKAGAIEFLTKPVHYQELLNAVGQAMMSA